jgi:hypothetical protein
LQRAGIIGYSRGKINILDRPKLTKVACECYEIVSSSYRRMLKAGPNGSLNYVVQTTDKGMIVR